MQTPAAIVCTKCGAASKTASDLCARCGGSNALVCSDCGFQNSITKNYCDKCGNPTSQKKPDLFADAPISGDTWEPKAPEPVPNAPKPQRWISLLRICLNTAAATAGVTISLLAIWHWSESRKPTVMVPLTAARHLEALRSKDFDSAYALFSDAAKKYCALEELKAAHGGSAWTWSNLRIERIEDNAVLFTYELKNEGAPAREDHLLFILENKRWVRPYNSFLIRKAENAFSSVNTDAGHSLAQTAAAIDPRDPVARGRLCAATYPQKSPGETVTQCEAAINLARLYPSSLTLKSLYRLHEILADTYKSTLQLPDQAIDHFAQMLAFPAISPADQCEILMARAEAYATISRPGEALADLERSAQLCMRPASHNRIEELRRKIGAPPHQ